MSRALLVLTATGSAAISSTYTNVGVGSIESIAVHLSSAPTSAGSLTVTLDAKAGAAYDTLLKTESMVGVTDLYIRFDPPQRLVAGDKIVIAYTNPDSRTYGLQVYADPNSVRR